MITNDTIRNNVITFRDSIELCEREEVLKEAIEKSKAAQRVFKTNAAINNNKEGDSVLPNITVTPRRTFAAALKYKDMGKTAVLNFADFYKPGGLVEYGSRAQEEALCRISTLYPCINDDRMIKEFYGPHKDGHYSVLYNNDIIYTPDVVVFKDDDENMFIKPMREWYKVDVITCAAPNLSDKADRDYYLPNVLDDVYKGRFKRILAVADHMRVENLILGAFGCGAFRNSPEEVAWMARTAIEEYYKENNNPSFKTIDFAVYCPPHDPSNYLIFKEWIVGTNDPFNKNCFDCPEEDASIDDDLER